MALTDIFVRQLKHSGNGTGEKHTDGAGMYLLVKGSGKYWHRNYRYGGKRNTLALGTYPEVSLAKAPQKRDRAREVRAEGLDPSIVKRAQKRATVFAAANTFEAAAREFHALQGGRMESQVRRALNRADGERRSRPVGSSGSGINGGAY